MGRIIPTIVRRPTRHVTVTRTLPNENLSLMMLTPKDIAFLRGSVTDDNVPKQFNLGEIIVLPSTSIEDMSFGGITFRLVGRIESYKGVDVSSYVLKEVYQNDNGEFCDATDVSKRNKLTMNRHMCAVLGIDYERGLELWPDCLNFIRYEDLVKKGTTDRPLDYSNMGTYPCNVETGNIDKICVELIGFRIVNEKYVPSVVTPTNTKIPLQSFLESLRFRMKIFENDNFVTAKQISPNENGKDDTSLFFELDVSRYGIKQNLLEGLDIDNVISVTWSEPSNEQIKVEIPMGVNINDLIDPSALIETTRMVDDVFSKLDHYMENINRENIRIDRELRKILK